jgi:tight adherence protein C
MTARSAEFLIALAAITFLIAALCFLAYSVRTGRERLRHRIDLLFGLSGKTATGRRGGDQPAPPSRLTAMALRGDVLEFARRLERLRIAPNFAPQLFLALRLTTGVAMAAAMAALGHRYGGARAAAGAVTAGLLGAIIGGSLPHVVIRRLAAVRKRAIVHGLPDAIELLVIAVEAGLSLEDAINRIVAELRRSQPAVAEELALTSADLRILPSRDEALRRLAERTDLPSVHSVVITLSQTLKYGTPLVQALRVIAAELRNDALIRLEEQTNRLPVMLTVPMILFILPSLFLIIGGPAVLKVLDVLSH